MSDKKLVIADGHHRYETALTYRNEQRTATGNSSPNAPHERVMMTFINTHAEGLLILPTHRVVSNLPNFDAASLRRQLAQWFDIGPAPQDAASLREQLPAAAKEARAIALHTRGESSLLTLKPSADLNALLAHVGAAQRELDVVLLHRLIFEKGLGITADAVSKESHITYEREMENAIAAVESGKAQAAFLLNPVSVEQTVRMALAGGVLPQKSTDFYPKLLSGLTIYKLD